MAGGEGLKGMPMIVGESGPEIFMPCGGSVDIGEVMRGFQPTGGSISTFYTKQYPAHVKMGDFFLSTLRVDPPDATHVRITKTWVDDFYAGEYRQIVPITDMLLRVGKKYELELYDFDETRNDYIFRVIEI